MPDDPENKPSDAESSQAPEKPAPRIKVTRSPFAPRVGTSGSKPRTFSIQKKKDTAAGGDNATAGTEQTESKSGSAPDSEPKKPVTKSAIPRPTGSLKPSGSAPGGSGPKPAAIRPAENPAAKPADSGITFDDEEADRSGRGGIRPMMFALDAIAAVGAVVFAALILKALLPYLG